MGILELVDKRNAKIDEMSTLVNLGETEKRKLSGDETLNLKKIDEEISELDAQIKGIQDQKAGSEIINNRKVENQTMENTKTLIAQINERSNGTMKGAIELMTEERAVSALGVGAGNEIIGEQKLSILAPLREALVLVSCGATYLTGLKSDISIPSYGGTNASWVGEVAAATAGDTTFAEVNLKAKRLSTFIDVSQSFLNQDTVGANEMLMQDLVNSVAIKLESTILGKVAGSATQPAGFFATAPAIAGAATWANMVKLETNVDTANALQGKTCYITNAGGKGLLKTVNKGAAGYPIYLLGDDGKMNGYPVLSTNSVASGLQVGANEFGVIFGNFNDLIIGQFGNVNLTVDPYTLATTGQVRITISAFFDAAPRRAASFAVASIK